MRVFVFYFSLLSSLFSLTFLFSLSRSFSVGLMGLDDCKWVWVRRLLKIGVEVRIGVAGVAGFVVGFRCCGFVPWVFFLVVVG